MFFLMFFRILLRFTKGEKCSNNALDYFILAPGCVQQYILILQRRKSEKNQMGGVGVQNKQDILSL